MRYLVLITETNIDETSYPQAFRYEVDAETREQAEQHGRDRFVQQTGREPAARATVDVSGLE